MTFVADLHVHSRFSRATAKDLTLESLYVWSQLKGIRLVATGDVTHPEWFSEIETKLIPAEPGLFKLKDDIEATLNPQVTDTCRGPVRFILEAEISNIYKADGRTRKNHNLIYLPDLASAKKLIERLDTIGNLAADGRPILGLDARDLLEITLTCHDSAFLVPAHIWTPWFSMLGSKSGFDSVTECFRDLAEDIFAVETGLSSNAPMNWRVSELDTRTLISNSDAHSPANLGRNANRFATDLSFQAIRDALRRKDPAGCLGTIDMFPEEGKYHMDGHRKCGVCQPPARSLRSDNFCEVCGKPLVLGVLHRVETLADRPEGMVPENALPHRHIIPLPEILSELSGVGAKSKTVTRKYARVLEALGPEMEILLDRSVDEIDSAGVLLLGEAIRRMREEKIHITPGYDGEYGVIRVFTAEERERLSRQRQLFDIPAKPSKVSKNLKGPEPPSPSNIPPATAALQKTSDGEAPSSDILSSLNPLQKEAVCHEGGPLLIVAGPGTGKTRTLTCRAAYLVRERRVPPERILAVTFTRKAAGEMADRLKSLMGETDTAVPKTATFHQFCRDLLGETGVAPVVIDEDLRMALIEEAARVAGQAVPAAMMKPADLADRISLAKQELLLPEDDLTPVCGTDGDSLRRVYAMYQELLAVENASDYDDLIFRIVRRLEEDKAFGESLTHRYPHILVDEYQDLNHAQYRLVRHLAPAGTEICVIGDPDQAIYGFRGSDVRYFERFRADYPGCRVIRLERNYRSTETILAASHQMIRRNRVGGTARTYSGIQGAPTLTILESESEKAEAVAIGKRIESLVGGTGFHSIDFGNTGATGMATDRAFSDIAVLYRSHLQGRVLEEVLTGAGIPCQVARRRNQYGCKGIAEMLAMLKVIHGVALFHEFATALTAIPEGPGRSTIQRLKRHYYAHPVPSAEILGNGAFPGIDTEPATFRVRFRAYLEFVVELQHQLAGRSVTEAVDRIIDRCRLQATVEKHPDVLKQLQALADRCGEDPDRFLASLAFQTDADLVDDGVQKVALLTLHAAKGLEFPVVFIAGCEDGLIPFRKSLDDDTDTDEERRLFYVGMTRARELLFLSHARKRTLYGRTEARTPSPFIGDIETHLTAIEKGKPTLRPEKNAPVQLNLFR